MMGRKNVIEAKHVADDRGHAEWSFLYEGDGEVGFSINDEARVILAEADVNGRDGGSHFIINIDNLVYAKIGVQEEDEDV